MNRTFPLYRLGVALNLFALALPLNVNAFNYDGIIDIVWHHSGGQNISWWGKYNREFPNSPGGQTTIQSADSTSWQIAATGDFNADGYTDLMWRNSLGQNAVWFMNGSTLLPNPAPVLLDPCTGFHVVGLGDFNRDGYLDILWRSDTDASIALWHMTGATSSTINDGVWMPNAGLDWDPVAVGDFNRDGYADIVLRNLTTGQNAVWLMNDSSIIAGVWLPTLNVMSWKIEDVGPFNMVGHTDIFLRNWSSGDNVLWRMVGPNCTTLAYGQAFSSLDLGWSFGGIGAYGNSMILSATATAPSTVRLNWKFGSPTVSVQRRLVGASTWDTLQSGGYRPPTFAASDHTSGQRYEYNVAGNLLITAVNEAAMKDRGKVILVVDDTLAASLSAELQTLRMNLIGDGWTVISTNMPRHDDITWANNPERISRIKNFIKDTQLSDPTKVKMVFLIGHVAIPHSGYSSPDNHGSRALPADGYYGDVDGNFTDTTNFPSPTLDAYVETVRHSNTASDGKWDQKLFPPNNSSVAKVELAVGRIDFANISVYSGQTELSLLKRYLGKDDQYRRKQNQLPQRMTAGHFFYHQGILDIQYPHIFHDAIRNGSRIFGSANEVLISGDSLQPEAGPAAAPATFATYGGYGLPNQAEGTDYIFHTSSAIASNEPQFIFGHLFGSYFHDWPYQDDLMRVLLGAPKYALGVMWFSAFDTIGTAEGRISPAFEQMALGDPVGYGWLKTVNDSFATASANTHINWLGDPTLRVFILAPPTGLTAVGISSIALNWTASSEAADYVVERSPSLEGPWSEVTTTSSTSFTDVSPGGAQQYRVRGRKLIATGSGSFYNLSQGVVAQVTAN